MGYESKLYVVRKSNGYSEPDDNGYYSELIATFYMCGIDTSILLAIEKYNDTDCYFYEGNGDSCRMIKKDCYGKPLKEIPLKDMIRMIEDTEDASDYRRYPPCLAMLRSFNEYNKSQWYNELVVLHYGY